MLESMRRSWMVPGVAMVAVAAAATPAVAAPDFAGTYVHEDFTVVLRRVPGGAGGSYTGTLTDVGFPAQEIKATVSGETLTGQYKDDGEWYLFTATLEGSVLVWSSDGETMRLTRQGDKAPPTAPGAPPGAPGTPATPAPATPDAGAPKGPSTATPPASAPAARGQAAGAPALRRVGGEGAAGAWVAEVNPPQPAAGLVRAALGQVGAALGVRTTLRSAVADRAGREAQAIFDGAPAAGASGGSLVRGLVSVFVTPRGQAVVVVCDDPARFGQSAPGLLAAAGGAVMPASAGAQQAQAPIDPASLQWVPVTFPDGSGSMRLPQGWTVTSAANGGVDANGLQGAVSLGAAFQVYTPAAAQGLYVRPPLIANYADPATALQSIMPQLYAASGGQIRITRIVEQQPTEYPGGQAAFVSYDTEAPGQQWRSLSLVVCAPVNNELWMYYMSTVASPRDQFARNLPVLMECWKNWRISDQLMAQRLRKAVETMKETNEIMRQTLADRSKTYDNINTAWGHVLRGDWPVEDTRTGERADVSNTYLKPVLESLNKAAGEERFREVPTQELNQWR